MILKDIIECISDPDCAEGLYTPTMEVVFDTSSGSDLVLLSTYVSDDGKIHVDIGEDDE